MWRVTLRCLLLLATLALVGCRSGESHEHDDDDEREHHEREQHTGLSRDQLEKGIGPVTEITLGAFDESLAARGEQVFTLKCSACHKPSERYVGPALGNVLERRTPEYVMNMILNPAEMVQKHPEARKLLAEFMAPMPNQSLTQDDARAVLEYLRSLAGETTQSTEN